MSEKNLVRNAFLYVFLRTIYLFSDIIFSWFGLVGPGLKSSGFYNIFTFSSNQESLEIAHALYCLPNNGVTAVVLKRSV